MEGRVDREFGVLKVSAAFLPNRGDGIQHRNQGLLTGSGEAGEIPGCHGDPASQ